MIKKLSLLLAALALSSTKLLAINTLIPKSLESLSSANVSCSIQDEKGAIWLNSNRGIFRYNGQSTEYLSHQLGQTMLVSDSAGHIFGLDANRLVKFDIHTLENTRIPVGNATSLEQAVMAVRDTTLYIGIGNQLYQVDGDTTRLSMTLDETVSISALTDNGKGRLLIGTIRNGLLTEDGSSLLPQAENITAIFADRSSTLWIGTQDKGLFRYDSLNSSTENIGLNRLFDIRSIIPDEGGDLLIGTSDGLYRLSPDARLTKESIDGVSNCPIRSLARDRDDNLWISTFYNGLILSKHNDGNYLQLDAGKEIQNIKGLSRDGMGHVYFVTDGNGTWVFDVTQGSFHGLKGTQGYKFQCDYYDEESGLLWAADFRGQVMSINPSNGRLQKYHVVTEEGSKPENITAIRRWGDRLYLAGIQGVYSFDPIHERQVALRIEGIDRRVFDLEIGNDGSLWAASYGLYRIQDGQAFKVPIGGPEWTDNATISDNAFDKEGKRRVAQVTRGFVCKEKDSTEVFTTQTCGLIDDFCYDIIPLDAGRALVSTAREISLLDIGGTTLRSPTGRSYRLIPLGDGTILAAGNEGIKIINPDKIVEGKSHGLYIDKFLVNGKRIKGHSLPPEDTGFSFEITSFDYTETTAISFFYRLRNYDEHWKSFDIKQPVVFTNMKPGKYTFEVEARTYSEEVIARDSFDFRLRPHWWATKLATILFVLLALAILATILNFILIRRKLTEEIVLKEKENKEKTRFFVNLSHQLRTPLNLAIGNLERFFYQYGARTPGIENLENVYKNSKEIRQLISEYVNTRLNQIEKEDEDDATKYVVKGAKLLNAATGVIERNLFSPELGVGLLCKELNMGKTNLTKRLKDASEMTPRAFIEDIKLKHAAQMLSDGVYRIAEIAGLLNFSSPKYFTQRFTQKFGVTPREYKNR